VAQICVREALSAISSAGVDVDIFVQLEAVCHANLYVDLNVGLN
jgi:hypothetical protein